MADGAESSRRAPPTPPPPSPTLPHDEANLWAACESSSSSAPHTDLLSLWLSNYTALPEPEDEEGPLPDVPTLLNFDLESSFLDLVDWKTTSTDVTQPLWMQLHAPGAEGEVDDPSRLALGLQSPEDSILQLALGIQDSETFDSSLALGMHPQPASSDVLTPQASLSPSALGVQSPPASNSFEIQTPETPIPPLAFGIEAPQIPFGIQPIPSSFSSVPPFPCTLPVPPPLWNLPPIPGTIPMAPHFWNLPPVPGTIPAAPPLWNLPPIPDCAVPLALPSWNLPSIPCTLPMPPPLWNLPSTPCTSSIVPPSWNLQPSPPPVPQRRSWSEITSTPPPACPQQQLPPHTSAPASVNSPSYTHHSHQPYDFFPAATTGTALAPVTFSSPHASQANFSPGFAPTSRPPWSQATAQRRSWTPTQPQISRDQDTTKLPTPRRPRFLLPSPAPATTAPAPSAPLLTNSRSSVRNMPSWIARGDAPVGEQQQRDQTGESSRPRKRSKRALDSSGSEALRSSQDNAQEALIALEPSLNRSEALHWNFNNAEVALNALERALNRDGKTRALPGTATDFQSLFSRNRREKMKQRITILQTLIPNGDKADTVILLEQAYMYIKFLEHQIKFLKAGVDCKLATSFPFNLDLNHPQ